MIKTAVFISIFMLVAQCVGTGFAQPAVAPSSNSIWIVEIQGSAQILPAGTTTWQTAKTNQVLHSFDKIHTAANSRVALRWSDRSIIPFGASTELEILPPDSPEAQNGLRLILGIISFFHRDKPGQIHITTHGAVAGVKGTEFLLAVDDAERTTLSVVDGIVEFGNEQATLLLTNGQQATIELGKSPTRTAGFIANNFLQWCFYYPAVIDPDELQLSEEEQNNLTASLAAYRAGDLPDALKKYSAGRPNISDNERVYQAALLLSVGEVEQTEAALSVITNTPNRLLQLTSSLRQLIAAVKRQPAPAINQPQTASECLARSYLEQSHADKKVSLKNALSLAKQATVISPRFGFAWERVAELEFSFGNINNALVALDKSLSLAPLNARALALKGYILAAQNHPEEAREWFDRSLAADSALGNAWLGRGLVRIRLGDKLGGREDLLVAAALEPQRAELRSYLGKAYAHTGDDLHATKELALAKKLDPNDPTAWFYSALLNQQNNHINDAIRDLEKSQALNDNRSVYRSSFLLDQDRAMRSANLATIYRDAGMTDVSVQEAGRAVNADYANYSAHLFLASSYDQLRQPNQNNSRYETAVESEYLLANLLAPASAGTLSSVMSQQQHFNPFERNHLGVVSSTEYLSRGAWNQSGLQYGTFDNFSYGLETIYQSDPGQRVNNDSECRTLALKLKWQLTPNDSIFAEVLQYQDEHGDLTQYYDPSSMASPNLRIKEEQTPTLTLGYHHEWGPGVHTLFLASRVDDDYSFNGRVPTILTARFADLTPDPYELVAVEGDINMHSVYHNRLALYSTELQQIWEQEFHTTIVGGRFQYGSSHTTNLEDLPSTQASLFNTPAAQQNQSSTFKRFSFYGYHQWQIWEQLQLIGGVSYDWLAFPENIISPPTSIKEEHAGQLSPKVGLIWTPTKDTTVRFAYSRSLGGQNLDQSQRIEPSQVAGFLQSFRSIISEPSVAHTGAAKFETFNLSFEQKFSTRTYLGLTGEILNSKVNQTVGAFDGLWDLYDFAVPSGLREHLDYQEQSIQFIVNQLLGRDWALGAKYRLSHAKLNDNFVDVPDSISLFNFQPRRDLDATLHHLNLFAIYNHPSGFFAKIDGQWFAQSNRSYTLSEPDDNFWQFDTFVGYRFLHRTAEVTVGVLNLADQNYKLNPLNAYSELPRERTLLVRFQWSF